MLPEVVEKKMPSKTGTSVAWKSQHTCSVHNILFLLQIWNKCGSWQVTSQIVVQTWVRNSARRQRYHWSMQRFHMECAPESVWEWLQKSWNAPWRWLRKNNLFVKDYHIQSSIHVSWHGRGEGARLCQLRTCGEKQLAVFSKWNVSVEKKEWNAITVMLPYKFADKKFPRAIETATAGSCLDDVSFGNGYPMVWKILLLIGVIFQQGVWSGPLVVVQGCTIGQPCSPPAKGTHCDDGVVTEGQNG